MTKALAVLLLCMCGCARPVRVPGLCAPPDININDRCISPQLAAHEGRK